MTWQDSKLHAGYQQATPRACTERHFGLLPAREHVLRVGRPDTTCMTSRGCGIIGFTIHITVYHTCQQQL